MAKCAVCKVKFTPKYSSLQKTCDIPCAIIHAESENKKKAEAKRKQNRKELREYKERNRTKPQWIKKTQSVFNRFIRLRDKDKPCISCGRYDAEIVDKFVGGKWDCGHYLTVGGFPELRFEELNANKQCKSCNGGSGNYTAKNKTVSEQYRVNLIERIGIKMVEWLEGPHDPKHWMIEDIKEIKEKFRIKIKELEE